MANKLADAFYMACEEDSATSKVQRVLQQGYQVNMRLRSLPLRRHDHIKIIVLGMIAGVAEVQQASAIFLSAKHVNSETCAQKGNYSYHGMYAKCVKENHAEMYAQKWETFKEAKVIFHQREHVFPADQKTSLLAVRLDYLMHHCDAQACEKNTTRTYLGVSSSGSVFF